MTKDIAVAAVDVTIIKEMVVAAVKAIVIEEVVEGGVETVEVPMSSCNLDLHHLSSSHPLLTKSMQETGGFPGESIPIPID